MKIVVCVKQLPDGEVNPFDACALECALSIPGAEVILLSMGRMKAASMLKDLTRLGNLKAILLSDTVFAGADTFVTARTLSVVIKKLQPDLILCGRQTLDGDTAQVGPEIAAILDIPVITNVMKVQIDSKRVFCHTRLGVEGAEYPVLLTIERINTLRFPGIYSKPGEVLTMTAKNIGIDPSLCGLQASPTQVITTFTNEHGIRNCKFIQPEDFNNIMSQIPAVRKEAAKPYQAEKKLKNVWITSRELEDIAYGIAETVTCINTDDVDEMLKLVKHRKPEVILFPADLKSRKLAPILAAKLETGLCADCIRLDTDGEKLFMYRPAFGGNITAEIKCKTLPQMATVRTIQKTEQDIMFTIGAGGKESITRILSLAEHYGASIGASRKIIDCGLLPYEKQVGLTGCRVSPKLYVAFGVSGAIHHIAGMEQSETVIAINRDRTAPIFQYADYGVVCDINDFLNKCTF